MGSETHALPVEVVTGTENDAAAAELDTGRSRRVLLKGLGVAAAGAVVGSVLSPEEAEAHGTFHADSNNIDPAIHGNNTDGGPGVLGTANDRFGIGVLGDSDGGLGVAGQTDSGFAVFGSAFSGTAVDGRTTSGIGVSAFSVDGTGVRAVTGNGLALDVQGPAKFSTAGAGTIPANQNSVAVSDPAVTADSHITMTYTGNPGLTGSGTFAAVVWVERQPGIGFTARLSRRVTNATPFTYLIVEPG